MTSQIRSDIQTYNILVLHSIFNTVKKNLASDDLMMIFDSGLLFCASLYS